ncbi:MAG TPA: hypothetical protein VF666_03260 [Pyrinomonadaceae bacterium]|jgi:hypothetical protein
MNKRAKKRFKEAIKKESLERTKTTKGETFSPTKQLPERRGFTAKPEKKRG